MKLSSTSKNTVLKNSDTGLQVLQNLAEMYDIEDHLLAIQRGPTSKNVYSQNVMIKITDYHEKELRMSAATNSKMVYLNVNVNWLNGRPYPALQGPLQLKKHR